MSGNLVVVLLKCRNRASSTVQPPSLEMNRAAAVQYPKDTLNQHPHQLLGYGAQAPQGRYVRNAGHSAQPQNLYKQYIFHPQQPGLNIVQYPQGLQLVRYAPGIPNAHPPVYAHVPDHIRHGHNIYGKPPPPPPPPALHSRQMPIVGNDQNPGAPEYHRKVPQPSRPNVANNTPQHGLRWSQIPPNFGFPMQYGHAHLPTQAHVAAAIHQPLQHAANLPFPLQTAQHRPIPVDQQNVFQRPYAISPPPRRRRAVLVGINYRNTSWQLNGCVNDVHQMVRLLHLFEYTEIRVLTDEQRCTNEEWMKPTKANIEKSLTWLVSDADQDSSLFFHFSGHGGQQRDRNGDEVDGLDECILPMDHGMNGVILDDWLYSHLVLPVPKGARLTAVMDCCNSGTGLDLPYLHDVDGPTQIDAPVRTPQNRRFRWRLRRKNKTSLKNSGTTVLYSACRDNQQAADILGTARGAFTTCFEEVARSSLGSTATTCTFKDVLRTITGNMNAKNLPQTPQLSTSHVFDTSFQFEI